MFHACRRDFAEEQISTRCSAHLGQIDLLVDEGFYSNRTDFTRTAIRNPIERQSDFVDKAVRRHSLDLGLRILDRQQLVGHRNASGLGVLEL